MYVGEQRSIFCLLGRLVLGFSSVLQALLACAALTKEQSSEGERSRGPTSYTALPNEQSVRRERQTEKEDR